MKSEELTNCIAVEFSWNGPATNDQESKRQIRLFGTYLLIRIFSVILRIFDSSFLKLLQKLLIFRPLLSQEF